MWLRDLTPVFASQVSTCHPNQVSLCHRCVPMTPL